MSYDSFNVCSRRSSGAFLLVVVTVILFLALPQKAKAAEEVTLCTPDEVAVFTIAFNSGTTRDQRGTPTIITPRLHVRCTASVGGIRFFAVSSSDGAMAARVLSVINTALVAGRTLTIRYDPTDLSGAGIGCLNADCRLILAIGFGR